MPILGRYGAAATMVVACLVLRGLLFAGDSLSPYPPLFAAVVISGALFDRWTGLFSTLLGAGIASYFFVAPIGSFAIASGRDLAAMAVFVATGLVIAVALEVLHRIMRRWSERA